jgi:putative two-component system response regulator
MAMQLHKNLPIHEVSLVPEAKPSIRDMKLVILDDDQTQIVLLEAILKRASFHNFVSISDPRMTVEVFRREQPDLLLLDLSMPHLSGLEVMQTLKQYVLPETFFPILILTADCRSTTQEDALRAGAKDFLTKPFRVTEVLLRIQNLLETRQLYLELQEQKQNLERLVQQRTRQLEQTQIEMLTRLARVGEYRDDESGEHVWRVAELSALLARELKLEPNRIDLLLRASRLHDIGKIAIPDGLLLKPTKLSPEEFAVIQTHTAVGAHLLSGGQSVFMQMAEVIALSHHEHWNGSGYPKGLTGESIPLEGRILAVADAFDALTHNRPHRQAQTLQEAVTEIQSQSGQQFDPKVVEAFSRLYERGDLNSDVGSKFVFDTRW